MIVSITFHFYLFIILDGSCFFFFSKSDRNNFLSLAAHILQWLHGEMLFLDFPRSCWLDSPWSVESILQPILSWSLFLLSVISLCVFFIRIFVIGIPDHWIIQDNPSKFLMILQRPIFTNSVNVLRSQEVNVGVYLEKDDDLFWF